ncbi:RNA-binding cell elongation regulator Jag/EloR, partial [Chloroflexota bacterium]
EPLEISAKTVDQAIQLALVQLGVSQKEVEVTIVKEGRLGILGLGAEEATVRVKPLTPMEPLMPRQGNDIADTAKSILESLLTRMGITASVVFQDKPFNIQGETEAISPVTINMEGDDLGILIGRRGQTLACLQYIVRLILAHQTKTPTAIVIDVEGYKQRRYGALQDLAWRIAEKVKERRMPFTLEPIPAYERRIIHLALADDPDITTQSIGEGEARKVVILPKEN